MTTQADQVPLSSYSVSDVLTQIANHYCQDVHQVQEEPPYFYDNSSSTITPSALSSIDAHWLESLCSPTSFDADVVIEYITGYSDVVRPRLVKDEVGFISLLQHFEQLLCHLMDRLQMIGAFYLSASDSERLWHQLRVLSNDIFSLTSASKSSLTPYIRANIAIPTLRRIQHHLLKIFVLEDGPNVDHVDNESLAGCVVSLFISSNHRLDPNVICPILTHEIRQDLIDICIVPPESKVSKAAMQFFALESIEWSSFSIDDIGWNDTALDVQTRSAKVVWTDIAALLAKQQSIQEELVDQMKTQQYVIQSIGIGRISAEIRSFFFERNMASLQPIVTTTFTLMGRRVTKSQPMGHQEKPYRVTPARAYAALVFCLYLSAEEEEEDKDVCKQLVENLLPVVLELVDSPDNTCCCLGVSALRLLLKVVPDEKFWLDFEAPCIAALESAFTTHRVGPTCILIGRTQCYLFASFQNSRHKRKPTTRQWLLRLQQLALGASGHNYSAWDMLVGGIIPLLFQHAKLPNADALELGRLGLSAMLPLLDSETIEMDKKTFALLFVALINLMTGAYPMMPMHKGKIMANLLAATTKLKTHDEGGSLFALGLHTAALAYVIVSSPGYNNDVENLLDTIIDKDSEQYKDVLVKVAKDIRKYAVDLQHRLKNNTATPSDESQSLKE